MSTLKILAVSLVVSITTGGVVFWLTEKQNKKVGVVDAVKLFDRFDMKKELEQKEKMRLEGMAHEVDSIGKMLQLAKASRSDSSVKRLTYVYGYVKTTMEESYRKGNQELNVQVWKRLNPVIEEFGKNNGLHVIIGANGMGSVLYNDNYSDYTDDAIAFANKKYAEGN